MSGVERPWSWSLASQRATRSQNRRDLYSRTMMPMMGIKKVISTSRLKMKNKLPIILPGASWTRGKIEFDLRNATKEGLRNGPLSRHSGMSRYKEIDVALCIGWISLSDTSHAA